MGLEVDGEEEETDEHDSGLAELGFDNDEEQSSPRNDNPVSDPEMVEEQPSSDEHSPEMGVYFPQEDQAKESEAPTQEVQEKSSSIASIDTEASMGSVPDAWSP